MMSLKQQDCKMALSHVRSAARSWLAAICVMIAGLSAVAQVRGQAERSRRQVPPNRAQQPGRVDPVVDEKPLEPSAVQSLLRDLDPKALNLSGAEMTAEIIGDQLILRGNESDLDIVERLITLLEQSVEQKAMQIVHVTEKDARDIASSLEPTLRETFAKPDLRPEHELAITALSGNILLVTALPEQMDVIIDLIKQVDDEDDLLPEPEQLVFHIKFRRASDVAEQLTEIVAKIRTEQGVDREIQIIPNDANNSILVLAPESERIKIQSLINELDVEPVKGWGEVKLTLFPLIHSTATEMAGVINDLLTSQQDRDSTEEVIHRLSISKVLPGGGTIDLPPIDLQKPLRIIADSGTESLIVATVEENVGPIGDLIRLMDGVPMAEAVDVKLFPLRFADAETVSNLLQEMFDGGGQLTEDPDGGGQNAVPDGLIGKALVYNLGLHADARTNTLIVTGRQEHLLLVARVVADLDRPATELKFPLTFIRLAYADATSIAKILTDLFEQRMQAAEATNAGTAAIERERLFMTVDVRSNSLIISASRENVAEIRTIARQLDAKPTAFFDQIRLIQCHRLSATDVQEKVEALWERKTRLRGEAEQPEDQPVLAVDDRSNTLLIASSLEDYEEVKHLVETLETQPVIEDTKIFGLEFADAVVLAGMLDELFQGIASEAESFTAPTVLPDPRSNALVIAGSRDAMDRAARLIDRLDVKAGPMSSEIKVYELKFGSAVQLSEKMETLFESMMEGGEIERTPIVLLPDEASNALIASASRDDHELIVYLLGLLDKPSSLSRQFEIFPLKLARATSVVERLESLFATQGGDSGGRADAIATEADERTNSVIVWASPAQMSNIAEVIERLDTSTPAVEMMVRVIQLRQALAEDFAEVLRTTLMGDDGGGDDAPAIILKWADQDGNVRQLLRQDIRLEADPRTNSLMVMAPAASMDMLEAMIREFDAIRPIASELRLFPLTNADAEEMVQQLEDIFDPEAVDGETQQQLTFGNAPGDLAVASVGQDLRFASDARTNTLIAAGAEVDLRMVETLVQYLDAQAMDNRVSMVYKTNYMDAGEIQSAISGFNDQEQDVLGELDDEQAAQRRMAQQISIEAVGDAEEGSTSLIIGMDRNRYQDTMDMIHMLDRPEPQVRISVIIAEVTLSDTLNFGIEIAGQELDFSRNAIVGPNGVINGSEFDFVGGTNLGAAGTGLGFNLTITGEDFSFLLNALQQNSRLEVLSRPTLVVRNGDEGNITIADQVPVVTSSQANDTGSTNSVVGREDVGVVLTVTPHISPDGYVTIELEQEISNFSGDQLQLTEGVTSPVFATREITTNVTIRDGESVVVGGLITSRRSEGVSKVPILGDLPYVGPLFRVTNIADQKTELLIVMTVDVLRTDEDVHRMSVAERDRLELPDTIVQSPLMESLRILPDEELLGPKKGNLDPESPVRPNGQRPDQRELFGPKPRTYGPVVPKARSTTTTKARTYGPKVVRNTTTSDS